MRGLRRPIPFVAVAVALVGVTCAFPNDNSPQVYVTIESPTLVLLDGDEMSVHARAWRLVGAPDTGNGDDQPITNVAFQWTSSDTRVAEVTDDGGGYATVRGDDSGHVDISARAVAFQQAGTGTFALRISKLLEIDSLTPPFIKWGDKLTMWGVGVRYAFLASLDGSALIPDTLSYVESGGFSHMEFWVPQPARTSQMFVLGPGIFFNTPDSVGVDTVDLYEPNTTSPTLLDIDGPGPYPQIPWVKFFNPALAFEELPRDTTTGYDWYRFAHSDTTKPLTLIVSPQGNSDSSGVFMVVADSIEFNGSGHQPASSGPTWFVTSQGFYFCPKGGFSPNVLPFDSMVVSLKAQPRYTPGNNGFHVLTFYGKRMNYTMAALDTLVTADKRIQPDRFEPNDICTQADAPSKLITVAPLAPFADTLTIHVPHDLDWYRVHVNAPLLSDTTTIRIRSRPFGGISAFDRSDLDLYVLDAGFNSVGTVTDVGSRDELRLALATGDYYLAVVDYAGEATRYSICISVRQQCLPPFAPPSAPAPAMHRSGSINASTGLRSDGHPVAIPASQFPRDRRFPFRRP